MEMIEVLNSRNVSLRSASLNPSRFQGLSYQRNKIKSTYIKTLKSSAPNKPTRPHHFVSKRPNLTSAILLNFQVWFQNRRMKDKRQRMAMAWPYAMYTDPTLAATLLAAATATLPPPPYHGAPGLPPTHLGPSYPAAAAAAYYAARYTPYPGAVPTSSASALHRPHPRTAAAYPAHPHLLQPHPSLPPLHLTGLGVPTVGNTAFQVNNPPTSAATTYRPTLLPELSPVHSDASSDCDCVGAQQPHPPHHTVNRQQMHEKTTPPPPPTHPSAQIKLPSGISIAGLQHNLHAIGGFEGKNSYAGLLSTPSMVQSIKIEPPKLFQPYKNDIPERA